MSKSQGNIWIFISRFTRGHVFAKTRIKNPCEVSKHDCGPVAALYFSARFLPFYGKPRSSGKFKSKKDLPGSFFVNIWMLISYLDWKITVTLLHMVNKTIYTQNFQFNEYNFVRSFWFVCYRSLINYFLFFNFKIRCQHLTRRCENLLVNINEFNQVNSYCEEFLIWTSQVNYYYSIITTLW